MSELQNRLEKCVLRLDRMGMRVEQAVLDALQAVREGDVVGSAAVDARDRDIDREEVEIEQECIRLLALYQPAAVDLRTICTIIKVNSDLERIADLAASIARRTMHVVAGGFDLVGHEPFNRMARDTLDMLGRIVRILATQDVTVARDVIDADRIVDDDYRDVIRSVLHDAHLPDLDAETILTVLNLAKALERIGDLCTNIAEDIIFLRTGDIVRHAGAFGDPPPDEPRR